MADSKSDTPRTDALQQGIDKRAHLRGFVVPDDVFDMADLARQLERELAAEKARADSLAAAVAPTFGCHCELEDGQAPDGCVLDEGRPQHCIYAQKLLREGQGKTSCVYWLQVAPMSAT